VGVVVVWFYASLPQLMLLVVGPYIVVNKFVGGNIPLTILVFDGWAAAIWLVVPRLARADTAVREFNERARRKQ